MSVIILQNEEDFYLLINGQNEYIGRDTPTPSQPFTLNGNPVIIDVHPMTSEETQEVKVDFHSRLWMTTTCNTHLSLVAVRNRVEGIKMKRLLMWLQILVLQFLQGVLAMRPAELFFILATLTSLAGYNLWQYFPEEVAFYGKCTAVSILLWVYAYYRLTSKHRWEMKCIAEVVSWWALVNCMDELFFNPFEVSWNEFITVFALIVLTFLRFYKVKLKRRI